MEQLFRPNLLGATPEENIRILHDYLYQLTEQLEFVLGNIGVDNLSEGLVAKLNSLGADIEAAQTTNAQTEQQVGRLDLITVNDVINSAAFAAAINGAKATEGTGFLRFSNGTLVCYGTASEGSATFSRAYSSAPIVTTNPAAEIVKSATGITSDTQTFDFIAIGKEAGT